MVEVAPVVVPVASPFDAVPKAPARPAVQDYLFIEVFCGQANLSRAMADLGFATVSIDHADKSTVCKVLQLDILSPSGFAIFESVLARDRIFWVHFAPPCGTFSAAHS